MRLLGKNAPPLEKGEVEVIALTAMGDLLVTVQRGDHVAVDQDDSERMVAAGLATPFNGADNG